MSVNMHEECVDLLRAVRDALDNPQVQRGEIRSAVEIVLCNDGTPEDVALVLRRFAANRRRSATAGKAARP